MAGGTGQRMGGDLPKQFLELGGRPMIMHTLDRFLHFDPHIKVVVVLGEGHREYWEALPIPRETSSRIGITLGGNSRYQSVKNGLQLMEDDLVVGIHDAVRPLVSPGTLERCYASAEKYGSGIPVTGMDDSVRKVREGGFSEHINRSDLRRVQTPQVFRSQWIKKAYDQPDDPYFTDDASVFESMYEKVYLVEGNRENIKITSPFDFQMATLIIQSMEEPPPPRKS